VEIKTIKQMLVESGFFSTMDHSHLETIAGCGKLVMYQPGDFLMREGDPATTFFVVRSGDVRIESYIPSAGPTSIATVTEGGVVGYSWLFSPYRCSFDAHAVTQVRAVALDGVCLRGKAEADHELGYQLLKRFAEIMVQRLQTTRRQVLDLYAFKNPLEGNPDVY
jgi:CRP-like cAMP-binding protein